MCINCRIIAPLSDDAAELLGVEKRKYLVYGKTLYKLMTDAGKNKFGGYNNSLHNYNTMKYFSFDDRNFIKKNVGKYELYEGKLRFARPIPASFKPPEGSDLYLELFEGDLVWG